MGHMKQLLLDIIESNTTLDEDDIADYSFPDYPIIPMTPAVFDDRELYED